MAGSDGDDPRNVLSYIAARLADDPNDQALAEVVDLDEYRRIRARRMTTEASNVTALRTEFDDDLDPVS